MEPEVPSGRLAGLMHRYDGLVRSIVFQTLGRHPDGEDVIQEVWTKAFERSTSLRDTSRVGSWLARIAHSTAIDTTRRTSRRQHLMQSELPDLDAWAVGGTVDEEVDWNRRETAEGLDAAIETLPPTERRIVRLHYYHSCPCERIGRYEGVSYATVRWRLARARQSLRVRLESE